ncbi:Rpn family recombination-promoting nuclease/putative transposase (plasmid) [Nostoc sp. UHCC 0302]|uniref:Rpn family recombination-promoting nuclease/putative transposase n=1 Tax=Nostoc sp. UHCC 0302 TaxID=3134896 RepID=UPI00311CDC75
MSYDNTAKYLAELYPAEFAKWLLIPEPQEVTVLKTELSLEPIRADFVTFLQTTNRILHVEFQTLATSNPPIPLRILDYYVRLTRQYRKPVTQVVIFLQETSDLLAFTEEYTDEQTTHRYRVIRLWEQDSTFFLDNPALLPLAPLTRTDSPAALLSQVSQRVARISDRKEKQNIAGCTEIFAGLRFEKDLIHQFLREDIMQESVIYQDILQKGEQREAFRFLNRQLNRRFGEIDSSLIERIRVLSTEQLEVLGEAFLDFVSVDDLTNWLNHQPTNTQS